MIRKVETELIMVDNDNGCVVGCFWWSQRYHHNDFGADGDCAAMEVVVMVIASQQWPRHQMVTARVVSYPLLPHT